MLQRGLHQYSCSLLCFGSCFLCCVLTCTAQEISASPPSVPMFCSLILIQIPTAEFAYGLPRVPCQSLVDSFCPCASGLGMPGSSPGAFCRAPHVLSQQPDGFYPSLSKQLTLELFKNYCFGSALMCLSQGSSANVCFGWFLGSLGLSCCCSFGLQSCALGG